MDKDHLPRNPVLIVGAGLAGLCSAFQCILNGSNFILIEKNEKVGGNSVKAATGISGFHQSNKSSDFVSNRDSPLVFKQDLWKVATDDGQLRISKDTEDFLELLGDASMDSISWLQLHFGFEFKEPFKTAGSTFPRTLSFTHGLPGPVMVSRLLKRIKDQCDEYPDYYRIITGCEMIQFIQPDKRDSNFVTGLTCKLLSNGSTFNIFGPVILTTGGFGASFDLVSKNRPDLSRYTTASASTATGDIHRLVSEKGGLLTNMDDYQLIPTGLVPFDATTEYMSQNRNVSVAPDTIIKHGFIINNSGALVVGSQNKFSNKEICDKLSKNPENYLILQNIDSKFPYMKPHLSKYSKTFSSLRSLSGVLRIDDPKQMIRSISTTISSSIFNPRVSFTVIRISPTILVTLGGINVNPADMSVRGMHGCYAAGEVIGGVHGHSMIVGSSLLGCVSFARIATNSATRDLLRKLSNSANSNDNNTNNACNRLSQISGHLQHIVTEPHAKAITSKSSKPSTGTNPGISHSPIQNDFSPFRIPDKEYTMEEVEQHNTSESYWIVIKNVVLDVTKFVERHPGGLESIVRSSGTDVTDGFEVFHDDMMVLNYAGTCVIGRVKDTTPYLEITGDK